MVTLKYLFLLFVLKVWMKMASGGGESFTSSQSLFIHSDVCTRTKRILTSFGTYAKTICYVEEPLNYVAANASCIENGMQLLIIDSFNTQQSVFTWANDTFENGDTFWINGRLVNGTWVTFNPSQTPLWSDAHW